MFSIFKNNFDIMMIRSMHHSNIHTNLIFFFLIYKEKNNLSNFISSLFWNEAYKRMFLIEQFTLQLYYQIVFARKTERKEQEQRIAF